MGSSPNEREFNMTLPSSFDERVARGLKLLDERGARLKQHPPTSETWKENFGHLEPYINEGFIPTFAQGGTTDAMLLLVDAEFYIMCTSCLLYTSDAADDLLCVDLGGRRIIKKKHNKKNTKNTN